MKARHIVLFSSVLISMALSELVFAQKAIYYKYVNNRGVNVISSQIPSEYVKNGYDIVTYNGRVLEIVPPELSVEAKALLLLETERLEKLKERDTQLLRRYSHPDDIEAAKLRKLSQNQSRIGLIELNIEKINAQIDLYQSLAAEDERAGKEISADTITSIEELKRDRAVEFTQRQQKADEADRIIKEHDADITRLKVIRASQR